MQSFLPLEESILLWIQSIRTDWLSPVMKFITHLGDGGLFWIALCLFLICFKKTRRAGLAGLISLAVCFVVNNLLIKNIVGRARPYEVISGLKILIEAPSDASFPSGHSCSSFAAATALIAVGKSHWRWTALPLAALIALSRLYVGVHYLSDVVVGTAVGVLGSLLTVHVLKRKIK